MDLDLEVVDINFPLLLGLDKLDQYKCYVNNVENFMVCVQLRWQHPITRKLGHLFYDLCIDLLYIDNGLRRIHRHFYHPKPDKIFNLMKKDGDPQANPETMKQLESITETCDICQWLANQPG